MHLLSDVNIFGLRQDKQPFTPVFMQVPQVGSQAIDILEYLEFGR